MEWQFQQLGDKDKERNYRATEKFSYVKLYWCCVVLCCIVVVVLVLLQKCCCGGIFPAALGSSKKGETRKRGEITRKRREIMIFINIDAIRIN